MNVRLVAAAVAVVLFTGLGIFGVKGALRVRQMRAELEALQRDNAVLRARAEQLSKQIEGLRHDPEYLEKVAREERGMVRQGETILKFPSKDR